MKGRRITIDGVEKIVTLAREDDAIEARIDDSSRRFRLLDQDEREMVLEIDGTLHTVAYLRRGDVIHFSFRGETWLAEVASPLAKKKREKEHSLGAPMPGSVLRIHVEVGDQVAKGATLLTLEAMKMEHQITAPYDGVVASVDCTEGAMVQPGVDLISIDPA